MDQCSIDHVLIVPELQSTDVPSLSCRLSPYVQRLPSCIANIKALPRGAHVAVLVPLHVFIDLIMDNEISILVHERLCKAQHRRSVIRPCPRLQTEGRIEAIRGYRSEGASAVEFDRAAEGIDDGGAVERAADT